MRRDGDGSIVVTATEGAMTVTAQVGLEERVADFEAELRRDGRRPDTIHRYAVAVREFENVATVDRDDYLVEQQAYLLVREYVVQMMDRDLAPTTILARLGRIATFLTWLGEERGSALAPAVAEMVSDVRRRYQLYRADFPPDRVVGLPPRTLRQLLMNAVVHRYAVSLDEAYEPPVDAGDGEIGTGPDTERGREELRYLHARAPDRTTPNGHVDVLASIRLDTGGGSAVSDLHPVVIPPEGLTMHLLASAPSFLPLSDQFVPVHVPQGRDSEWVTFSLRATAEGIHPIEVHVLNGGTHLGSVVVQVAVAQEPGAVTVIDRTDVVDVRTENSGEVSLFVEYVPTGSPPVLRYRLTQAGSSPDWISHDGLAPDLTKQVEMVITELGQLAADRSKLSPKLRKQRIEAHGAKLWDNFVPTELKAQFWSVADRITRLTIVSSLDPIPWELLYPVAEDQNRGFLVDWVQVVRRHSGEGIRSPSLNLPFGATTFVLPADSPTAASKEVSRLRQLDASLAGGRVLATAEDFTDAIAAADFDLMHFACHNTFKPGSSALKLGGQDIDTTFMAMAEIQHVLGKRTPLVFMNACRSAGQAPVYTSIDGWAHSFARAGAGAFIGTLWLVRDSTAFTFAEAFYGELVSGSTLGAAIHSARQASRSSVGDPTWLAYAAYGDPDAVLKREA